MFRLGSLVIISISIIHGAWGIALLQATLQTTGIDLMMHLCGGNVLAGLAFIAAGMLASISTWSTFEDPMTHIALLMPQQFLMFVSMVGAMQSMFLGRFADGIVRPPMFIFVDQVWLIVLCIAHVAAIVLGYGCRRTIKFIC